MVIQVIYIQHLYPFPHEDEYDPVVAVNLHWPMAFHVSSGSCQVASGWAWKHLPLRRNVQVLVFETYNHVASITCNVSSNNKDVHERRSSKNYEKNRVNAQSMVYLAMISVMVKRFW